MPAPAALLERDAELATLAGALKEAANGEGALVVVSGEAGAGKTSLLRETTAGAGEQGCAVLRARCGEFERDFPHGVVRQLFEPVLADPQRRRRLLRGTAAMAVPIFSPGADTVDEFGLHHGLYWLLADLANERSQVLVVDDAQWADAASLRALRYLGRRLDGLAVALVVGIRTGTEPADADALADLEREPGAVVLRPGPLTVAATGALIQTRLGERPEHEFAEACRRATGGNPLYLVELMHSLEAGGAERGSTDAEELAALAVSGLAPSIRTRIARLGEDCVEVARAIAVLEPNAEQRRVGALSGLPAATVTAAAERLIAAQVLLDGRPLAFVHPLVRAAVDGGLTEPSRAAAHSRAARILAADEAETDTVAAHLLLSEPADDAWTVAVLRRAGAEAQARGAPEAAVRYLRRALSEPPAAADREATARELGVALLRANQEEGVEILRAVRDGSEDLELRAEIAFELGNSLALRGYYEEAATLLEESLAEVGDPASPAGQQMRGYLLMQQFWGLERALEEPLLRSDAPLAGQSLPERMLLQASALALAFGAGPISRSLAFVEAAMAAGPDAVREDNLRGLSSANPAFTLALADQRERAEGLADLVIETAKIRASAGGSLGYGVRALVQVLNGELAEAQLNAEIALPRLGAVRLVGPMQCCVGVAARAMIGRGELAEAEKLLVEHANVRPPPAGTIAALLHCVRGELAQSRGRHDEARPDFIAAGERLRWLPFANAELFGWRGSLALSEAALGNRDRAAELAAEEVRLAGELGSDRALGAALRAQGQVAEDELGVELLSESVAALDGTGARLQLARSLVELGAALRRANRRREAREPLRRGLDLAHRCGATPLEERARTELAAAGARPRRPVLSGVESLTPSELRVTRLAAAGATNREIAQQLFVSPKTVETHLRHAFQKLDVRERAALGAAIEP